MPDRSGFLINFDETPEITVCRPMQKRQSGIGDQVFQTGSRESVQTGQKNDENGERAGGKNERTSKTPERSPQTNHPKRKTTPQSPVMRSTAGLKE